MKILFQKSKAIAGLYPIGETEGLTPVKDKCGDCSHASLANNSACFYKCVLFGGWVKHEDLAYNSIRMSKSLDI